MGVVVKNFATNAMKRKYVLQKSGRIYRAMFDVKRNYSSSSNS